MDLVTKDTILPNLGGTDVNVAMLMIPYRPTFLGLTKGPFGMVMVLNPVVLLKVRFHTAQTAVSILRTFSMGECPLSYVRGQEK